jgi:hypothetical protein
VPTSDTEPGSYRAKECERLRLNWFLPKTHLSSLGSIMSTFLTNISCNIFSSELSSCTLGGLNSFAVNATSTSDHQKAVAFVRHHNIRLVICNTGHHYDGKSTDAGRIAIWTHYMKTQELVDYRSPGYAGKAVKIGAGVEVAESYRFAQKHGLVNVVGESPTVGIVGG